MSWHAHVTLAAVIERDGRFLLVEEEKQGRLVLNQPAGHLEEGESLLDGVIREVLEETGLPFSPEGVVGIYRYLSPGNGITYLRIAVHGSVPAALHPMPRDPDIIRCHWLRLDELRGRAEQLRSPMVTRVFEEYLAGSRYPLDLLREVGA